MAGGADFISGLGRRTDCIRAGAAAGAAIGPEERSLVGLAGDGTPIGKVIERSGLPEPKAIALLLGLRLKGLILPGSAPSTTPFKFSQEPTPRAPSVSAQDAPNAGPPKEKAPIDEAALREAVELDDAKKREILEMEARCAGDEHFEVLGLAPTATADEVKKAYYNLTRLFHPDRYFGKKLGSYKGRIEDIFKRVSEAQSVLTDANRRAQYLDEHPELKPAALVQDPERAAERRARLARHPYLAKQGKLVELLNRGRALVEKGEFARALADLTLANQIDPKNAEVEKYLTIAKRGGDKGKSKAEFDEGVGCENMGDLRAAVTHFRSAASLNPESAEFAYRLCRALLGLGGPAELKEAHQHARRATELAPENADMHLTFARILMRVGLEKNAIREFETVLKLRPGDAAAKEMLRKLKWKL